MWFQRSDHHRRHAQAFDSTGWRTRWSAPGSARLSKLLRIGLPIGATIFAEMGLFSFTTLLLGRFGSEVVAAHNISMNINGVLFMPHGTRHGHNIRIGYRIGQGELLDARETALVPGRNAPDCADWCSHDFRPKSSTRRALHDETAVATLATELLLFVVFFCFSMLHNPLPRVLRIQDTQIPMRIALLSYWVIGLPVGCALGYGWFSHPWRSMGFGLVWQRASVRPPSYLACGCVSRNEVNPGTNAGDPLRQPPSFKF